MPRSCGCSACTRFLMTCIGVTAPSGLIITHKSFVASHDEKHVGDIEQMLKAAPQHMRTWCAVTFARQEAAKPGNPQHRLRQSWRCCRRLRHTFDVAVQ